MTNKKIAAFILISCFASPLHAAKYKIHWYLGHSNLDFFEEAAANFKRMVETGSHGDIEVEVVTAASDAGQDNSAQSPSSPEIAAKVEKGEIEMGHSFTDVMGGLDHRLWAFEAPYLFRNYRHMEGVLEGPVGSELLDELRAHHMVGLSFTYSGGACGVATTNREIRRPEDLKGLKVGVYGDKVNEAWVKSLGAAPVALEHRPNGPLQFARDGSLDSVVITWRNFQRANLEQDFKYFNLMDSSYLVSVTYINEKFFESLPEAYRTLIKEASRSTGRIERAKTIELNENAKQAMLAKGVYPVYLTEANKLRLLQALRPAYDHSIDELIGKNLIERIKNTQDAPDQPSMASDVVSR